MTRSYRHSKVIGTAKCRSERWDKKIWHSKFRAKIHTLLASGKEADVDIKEVSDPWSMNKDGKNYWPDITAKYMRK